MNWWLARILKPPAFCFGDRKTLYGQTVKLQGCNLFVGGCVGRIGKVPKICRVLRKTQVLVIFVTNFPQDPPQSHPQNYHCHLYHDHTIFSLPSTILILHPYHPQSLPPSFESRGLRITLSNQALGDNGAHNTAPWRW